MTLIERQTDVLGGYEQGKGGGVVGGFNPLNPFRGWRVYSVLGALEDPAAIENPVIAFKQISGPPADTVQQVHTRLQSVFVDRAWSFGTGIIRGSYPSCAWYFLDPVTLAVVAAGLLPVGDAAVIHQIENGTQNTAPFTFPRVQWFELTPPTGPYIGFCVSREPSADFPLWVSGHPVEIIEGLLTRIGEQYEASTAASAIAAMGAELRHILPVTDPEQPPQDVIDAMSQAHGLSLRRSETSAKTEFVYWRDKIAAMPSATIDNDTLSKEGGPTFKLSASSRASRLRVRSQVVVPWQPGTVMVPQFSQRKFLGIPIGVKTTFVPRPALLSTDKPASGLSITSAEATFDYSTDGVTPDADEYGEAEVDVDLLGAPALENSVAGGAVPLNFEQWAEGLARMLFDAHARGRVTATFDCLRETDADTLGIGDPVTVDVDHSPNAQLGQTPTSQRGGPRPFRVTAVSPHAVGRLVESVDEGTGVPLAIDVELVLSQGTMPGGNQVLTARVSPAEDLATARAQVEFQIRAFPDGAPIVTADPGLRYTIVDTSQWPETGTAPHLIRLGEFPPNHQIVVRARAWLFGGGAGAWSSWYTKGGPVTGPTATLSNLIISNVTDEGADLDWSYDQSPQVDDVRVQYRDVTGGVIGPWTDAPGSEFPPGTEDLTLSGLASGHEFEVRVVLFDGAAEVIPNELVGSFTTTGGKISGLSVSSVDASSAKLNWTNTDASRHVLIELQNEDDPAFWTYIILAPGSNRHRLVNLIPDKDYDVRVSLYVPLSPPSLIAGVAVGDGAGGPPLTASFTTLAVSVTLEFPLMGGPFEAWDPTTAQRHDGRFGCRLHANPNNIAVTHDIVVLLAVETAVGSGTPGTFVEQAPIPATPGVDLWFAADAPNDGKLRYMKAISRALGYTDSIETVVVDADPWPETGPTPPAGGGIPNTHTITELAVTAGNTRTGSFLLPDGAELFRVESANAKAFRIRLYKDSATVTSDVARPVTNSLWPAELLFDTTVESSDGWLIDIPLLQRVKFLLAQHEDGKIWYRLDSLEAGTEDLQCRLYYFASPTTGTLA